MVIVAGKSITIESPSANLVAVAGKKGKQLRLEGKEA
jgi:hypothetical protein